jgi:hypothetical protein
LSSVFRLQAFRPAVVGASIIFILVTNLKLLPTTAQVNGIPDCLYADAGDSSKDESRHFRPNKHPECLRDVLNISKLVEVQQAQRMFGLRSDQITFIGCAAAPFMTFPAGTDPPYRVEIFYPLITDKSDPREYFAPILHEIGHAYQLNHAGGSIQKLKDSLHKSTERVELGADFLAGIAARLLKIDPGEFETSLYLSGSYYAADEDPHGNQADRSLAFRYGYEFPNATAFVDSQYTDFQRNGFGLVKHMGAPQ